MHGVMDDNINSYKSMMIYAMRMSKGYEGECLSVYKEPNADVTRFFEYIERFYRTIIGSVQKS